MDTITEPTSKLVKCQRKQYGPRFYSEGKHEYRITAHVRYDDECGNGHNTFSITATTDEKRGGQWRDYSGGCCHDEIAKHFPELAPFIKWHLVSSDGPMHYVANTVYHASSDESKGRRLDFARSSAVWPDATDEDLTAPGLKQRLLARLPALMAEFKAAMESLGFTF